MHLCKLIYGFLFTLLFNLAAGAGLTGTKMARRTGSVDEFEFKPLGENHNQGVSFSMGSSCLFFFFFRFLFLDSLFFHEAPLNMYLFFFLIFFLSKTGDSNYNCFLYQRLAVEILVSGFVFDQEDFVRPWEGQYDNSERYRLIYHFTWVEKMLILYFVCSSLKKKRR